MNQLNCINLENKEELQRGVDETANEEVIIKLSKDEFEHLKRCANKALYAYKRNAKRLDKMTLAQGRMSLEAYNELLKKNNSNIKATKKLIKKLENIV